MLDSFSGSQTLDFFSSKMGTVNMGLLRRLGVIHQALSGCTEGLVMTVIVLLCLLEFPWEENMSQLGGRQQERVQPGWVARGRRCRHKQSVSHKHGHPHQPAATRDFYELGKCGYVYSHSPVPAGMLGTASLPAASTAGSSQLREGSVSRGPWILPTVWFTSGLHH